MDEHLVNKFFDINKLPPEEGILVFPISMSRISNAQSAKKCWEYLQNFSPSKVIKPLLGLNIIYGDFLYFNSDEKASTLKNKFMSLTLSHKNELMKIIKKNQFSIGKAFSFTSWNQALLEHKDFINYLGQLKRIYKEDKVFQKYLKEDLKINQKLDENQINFFLEETLLFYLTIKGKGNLPNGYIEGHEKWILWCYPGKPLKIQIYVLQNNFLKLKNPKNTYENSFYDLEEKKLYDFAKIDLEKLS
jgi:hypothetical protein